MECQTFIFCSKALHQPADPSMSGAKMNTVMAMMVAGASAAFEYEGGLGSCSCFYASSYHRTEEVVGEDVIKLTVFLSEEAK